MQTQSETMSSGAAVKTFLVFDASTDQLLGVASPALADQAGIRQHMGDLWARKVGDVWVHWSRVVAADAPFAAEARNVYVEQSAEPRKSPGHIRFWEGLEFFERGGQVYRARISDPFADLGGESRHGRWECSTAHFKHYEAVICPEAR